MSPSDPNSTNSPKKPAKNTLGPIKKRIKAIKKRRSNNGRRPTFEIIVIGMLALSLAGTAYFYKQYANIANDPQSVQSAKNQEESSRVLSKVKQVLLITETDEPRVARIEDPEKLKAANPDFYRDIQRGDYLIVFPGRAIVFRENNNQIINVAAVSDGNTDSAPAAPSATQPANQ